MIKTIKKVAVIIMAVVIMITTFMIADQTSSTTIQAASGYSGKIYKHWCKLRIAKSKRSKTIKKLSVGTKVTVLSTSGSWRKIKVGNKTGYALKKYVYISTNAPKLTGSTYNKGQTVASFAQRFVGNPYVWGGTNLNTGADCSGFGAIRRYPCGVGRGSAANIPANADWRDCQPAGWQEEVRTDWGELLRRFRN